MPPAAPPLYPAHAARRAFEAPRALGLAYGLLVALALQPPNAHNNLLNAKELKAPAATQGLEAFTPTTTVRLNVNAVLGASAMTAAPWMGAPTRLRAFPCSMP